MDKLRIVIVEDEPVTARNLGHMLKTLNQNLSIVQLLPSVKVSAEWFAQHPAEYDLIFMDIQLADGLSFDIFKLSAISSPVVFVTAYDTYAIQAFKNNGIDYILKPFDETELAKALDKFISMTGLAEKAQYVIPANLIQSLADLRKTYTRSFLIHHRDRLIPLEVAKIAWFFTAHELVYAWTYDNRQFTMEFTMEQLEQQLDPELFFRANRQFIVQRKAIHEVEYYFNGRLSLKVTPVPEQAILISKARVPLFKSWMQA